jgi:hypothetical protein
LDSVFLLLDVRFLKGSGCLFFGSGLFRLLIQRCKNVTGTGNLFDKGGIRLDEGEICPTNGFFGGGGRRPPWGRGLFWAVVTRRKIKPPRILFRGGNFFVRANDAWFFRTPDNKFSMDDRIKTGFQDLMGFRFFNGLDVRVFHIFRILGSHWTSDIGFSDWIVFVC